MTLHLTRAEEIKLDNLDDGPGLLPFKLGPASIITHYHTFLQYTDLNIIEEQLDTIRNQMTDVKLRLDNYTYALYEFQIDYLSDKLDTASFQLQSLQPNRVKRGLIDGLGSIIKSITGNLDYSDALKYDNILRNFEKNQNELISEYNHHISLSKDWMNRHTQIINLLVDNQELINKTLISLLDKNVHAEYTMLKYAKFSQMLSILTNNVNDLLDDLKRIENILAFTGASSTHHSMLRVDTLSSMIVKIKKLYNKPEILDLELREYYKIIRPGSYYSENKIVFIFGLPIISPTSFTLYKLAIVPNKNNQILIPSHPYIATNEHVHVYIEAECPKYKDRYLCEEKYNHQLKNKPDCIYNLIQSQTLGNSCNETVISLSQQAMEKLDDRHYTITFPTPTKVTMMCNQDEHSTFKGSYLLTIPQNCIIKTDTFTIDNINDRLRGSPIKIMKINTNMETPISAQPILKLNSLNLNKLHSLQDNIDMQHPIEPIQSQFLYHTTAPLYSITTVIIIIIIILLCQIYLKKYQKVTKIEDSPKNESENYPENSSEGREIPPTFSLKVLK